jgi:hypothetical protein
MNDYELIVTGRDAPGEHSIGVLAQWDCDLP